MAGGRSSQAYTARGFFSLENLDGRESDATVVMRKEAVGLNTECAVAKRGLCKTGWEIG